MVEEEETGERLYFRFYDPGALRVFWRTCTGRQRAELLGDAAMWICEDKSGALLQLWAREDDSSC
jgi:hypothetical protein